MSCSSLVGTKERMGRSNQGEAVFGTVEKAAGLQQVLQRPTDLYQFFLFLKREVSLLDEMRIMHQF